MAWRHISCHVACIDIPNYMTSCDVMIFQKDYVKKKSKSFFYSFFMLPRQWRHLVTSWLFQICFPKKPIHDIFVKKKKFVWNLFIFPYWGHMTSRTFRKKNTHFPLFFFNLSFGSQTFSFFFPTNVLIYFLMTTGIQTQSLCEL